MNKKSDQAPQKKPKSSKKKYLLMGGIFVLCALILKRDAH